MCWLLLLGACGQAQQLMQAPLPLASTAPAPSLCGCARRSRLSSCLTPSWLQALAVLAPRPAVAAAATSVSSMTSCSAPLCRQPMQQPPAMLHHLDRPPLHRAVTTLHLGVPRCDGPTWLAASALFQQYHPAVVQLHSLSLRLAVTAGTPHWQSSSAPARHMALVRQDSCYASSCRWLSTRTVSQCLRRQCALSLGRQRAIDQAWHRCQSCTRARVARGPPPRPSRWAAALLPCCGLRTDRPLALSCMTAATTLPHGCGRTTAYSCWSGWLLSLLPRPVTGAA